MDCERGFFGRWRGEGKEMGVLRCDRMGNWVIRLGGCEKRGMVHECRERRGVFLFVFWGFWLRGIGGIECEDGGRGEERRGELGSCV